MAQREQERENSAVSALLVSGTARSRPEVRRFDKLPGPDEETMLRRLADGREFHIVKRFYEPHALKLRLAELGWGARVHTTSEFFIYGHATPSP
jgi:hypothetical protein